MGRAAEEEAADDARCRRVEATVEKGWQALPSGSQSMAVRLLGVGGPCLQRQARTRIERQMSDVSRGIYIRSADTVETGWLAARERRQGWAVQLKPQKVACSSLEKGRAPWAMVAESPEPMIGITAALQR